MSMIREKQAERTGFQERAPYHPGIDVQCDFVMVYGVDDSMPGRVREYREKGYVVHLMTGSAWGEYQDYLNGKWDGRKHWDESQTDRAGKPVLHGKDVPYMVPSVSFSDYLTERLKAAVDAGVEAIHMEEPEFWDFSGYSAAFKREYALYYREPWQPPHSGLDAHYRAARLKAYLYARALSRISSSLKEYAMVKYGRNLRFYVPTHSLLNYTQWKIMSPEAALLDIPSVDGYIAQVWTGTSRSANLYGGVVRERTFETAYLEYGVMQELVRGTGRDMWFLHDPIEDNPGYAWEDYEKNYLRTVTASLLHPAVSRYEVCPWPNRVFRGKYPVDAKTRKPAKNARPIPPGYASLLCGVFQTLGNMDQKDWEFCGSAPAVGIFLSDSGLFQRSYPDGVFGRDTESRFGKAEKKLAELVKRQKDGENCAEESRALCASVDADGNLRRAFSASATFPAFFGMALPLLKYGLPLAPVQLDNVRRYPGCLDGYSYLVLSYELMKPASPDVNQAVASWVREGGTLFYVGDGGDPFHRISAWWNRAGAGYANPAEHLFEALGLGRRPREGTHRVGKGRLLYWEMAPARLCLSEELASKYRGWVRDALESGGARWDYANRLTLRRGPYLISAVMDESVSEEPQVLEGLYADLYTPEMDITQKKVLRPGDCALLYDFSRIADMESGIVGSSARVFSFDCGGRAFSLTAQGPDAVAVFLRVRLPEEPREVRAEGGGVPVAARCEWDDRSRTLLVRYDSRGERVTIGGALKS